MEVQGDDPLTGRSVARFNGDELRGWRVVLAGMSWMRWTIGLLAPASCACAVASWMLDRSDVLLAYIVFGAAHAILAVPFIIGLFMCCLAPPESRTRRSARRSVLLGAIAAYSISLCVGIALAARGGLMPAPLRFLTQPTFMIVGALTLLTYLAIVVLAVINLHGAVSHDLGDPSLSDGVHVLGCGWSLAWAVGLVAGIAAFAVRSIWIANLLISVISILELYYLALVGRTYHTIRMTIGDPLELHARRDHPGDLD